jgi:cytoskeletal protein CcmA (bactofilin family)
MGGCTSIEPRAELRASIRYAGNIECKGQAQVFGRIEGELRASDLLISDGAQVEGSIIAQNVTVFKGTIRAVRVELQKRWCGRG